MRIAGEHLRLLVSAVAIPLPQAAKRALFARLLGWQIDRTAHIGWSFVTAPSLTMHEGARIGSFNLIRCAGSMELGAGSRIGFGNIVNGCERVTLGASSIIEMGNWISGPARSTGLYRSSPDRRPEFSLGDHSAVVRSHRIECADAVTIGNFVNVGGTRSEILTHGADVVEGIVRTRPVEIGDYCLLNTRVVVVPGACIPPRTVVLPGAVVSGTPGAPGQVIGGVPARPIRRVPDDAKYFTRTTGPVGD